MSKISNAFLMIKLLSNGRVYSVKELSMELGVTERMVRYYKEQLEMAGYIIESFKGPGGGYYINKNDINKFTDFNYKQFVKNRHSVRSYSKRNRPD